MKKLLFAVFAILGFIACGQKSPAPASKDKPTRQNEPGDSTHYGLACDDIIRAYQERQIYGRPRIGDELAVILNPEDKQEALKVINIERLKGQWCYQVTPTFRNIDKMPQKMQRRMMERIPDSVKERLMAPREYAIRLKRNHFAQSVGAGRNSTNDNMSPVEYPKLKRYASWKLYNGRLILVTDTARLTHTAQKRTLEYDTADIVRFRRDTLVLRFKDHEQTYYRKKDSTNINK